jgi:sterol desaturase/sphingolipid hydroxylase (fatty acid hydroxylase superfamily)
MFDSRSLDRLTRVHVLVVPLLFVPVIAILLGNAVDRLGVATTLAWAVGGYAFWTLTEYWLHRTVFHFEPEHPVGARMHWMIHGVHHDHPNDPLRLVMPPSASLPLATAFLALFYAVLGWDVMLAFGGGFLLGYLAYDMVHFHVHHHRPRTALGRRLREHHMRHHFQDGDRSFGVSAPWWDYVFGTPPQRRGNRQTG